MTYTDRESHRDRGRGEAVDKPCYFICATNSVPRDVELSCIVYSFLLAIGPVGSSRAVAQKLARVTTLFLSFSVEWGSSSDTYL